jgi:glycosyltransferase involved in cell wall biosynthesis
MRNVLFIQRVLADYRAPFFLKLHDVLRASNIQLQVIAGLPWPEEAVRDELDQLPFGRRMHNQRLWRNVYWQRGARKASTQADLIIFEQANAALHLYPLLLRWGAAAQQKLAYFGHGRNLNVAQHMSARERWKRIWLHRVDWWFAYTELTQDILAQQGYPRDRITVVNNSIDTTQIGQVAARCTAEEKDQLFTRLFGDVRAPSTRVGVFCGRLTSLKWIPFLLEMIQRVQTQCPDFRMILIGDGTDRLAVEAFCAANPWCVYVGPQHGQARVPYLALGDIWINPGMTGLAILDALTLGLPFISTANGIHSPEIAYLRPGSNGLLPNPDIGECASAITALLGDAPQLKTMKAQARRDASSYSIERMVERFHDGICAVLNS